jgi:hypothetical protein
VWQLANEYPEEGTIPELETPDHSPYADYPDDLEAGVLDLHQGLGAGAVTIAHVLRVRDSLSNA